MENKKICLVDFDDTTVDLLTEWLRRYNAKFDDCLTKEDITDWDMIKFVKPACHNHIYDFLRDPDLYESVEIIPGALEGIQKLKEYGYRTIFLSSGIHPGKQDLLFRHKLIDHPRDIVIAYDKSLIAGSRGGLTILIDDGYHNIQAFNGPGILLDKPHNRHIDYNFRAMNWDHAVRLVGTFEVADQLINSMRM
jgi:5'(3')-deoxyribonucleotidase